MKSLTFNSFVFTINVNNNYQIVLLIVTKLFIKWIVIEDILLLDLLS